MKDHVNFPDSFAPLIGAAATRMGMIMTIITMTTRMRGAGG
jgi:hypothetical protein